MNNGFKLFKDEAVLLENQFPGMKYVEGDQGIPEIVGTLQLTDDQGNKIDVYEVRIVYTPGYPFRFPLVYEIGGRLPINIDWHVYPDGHACICTVPEEIIICHAGITVKSFIEQHVRPYFFNQKHREINGFFLKERSHGPQGNIEFFKEVFGTKNLGLIAQSLLYIKSNSEPNRVQICFCGSGIKYRRCHRQVFRLFKPLPGQILDSFIRFLLSHN